MNALAVRFRATPWNIMYVGAVLCALISAVTLYQITLTNETSNEWIIWLCVLIGFSLFGFGFLYENKYKKDKHN